MSMYGNATDLDSRSSSLFSGGGFMPSQATQTPDSTSNKTRNSSGVLPLTVKQISEAYHSNDDKSNFAVDGVDASSVRLLGIIMNKAERVTDVSFSIDDGTGRIDVNRWVNESSDTNEMELIQNGMYVKINGSLKGFQGKKHVVAFSVRPVTDFNDVTLHFLECIHVHLENTRPKSNTSMGTVTSNRNDGMGYQTPVPNKVPSISGLGGGSDDNIYQLVLNVFIEPANLAREHGIHIDEIMQRLRLPPEKIKDAIEYHIDTGNIYSTIDENHFKSALNG